MRNFGFGFLVALMTAALTGTAAGQEVSRPMLAPPESQAPASTAPVPIPGIPDGSPESAGQIMNAPLVVSLNKARIINLPVPAARVVVANESIADIHFDPATPRQMFVLARSLGTTSIFVMDEKGKIIHQTAVEVALDPTSIEMALADLLPDESVYITAYQGSVFLRGNASSPAVATRAVDIVEQLLPEGSGLINMMQITGRQQVILKVQVAEMVRTIAKSIRVNSVLETATIGALGGRGIGFAVTQASQIGQSKDITSGTLNANLPFLDPVHFDSLERQGFVKTLAEPLLVAASGEEATFLAGGSFPRPTTVTENGVAYTDTEYGVKLSFTPHVLDEGRISLQIATEVSDIDVSVSIALGSDISIPGLTTKRTTTNIDLPSGGTIMISGILEEDMDNFIDGMPFLKDIPVLGALFRSTQFSRNQTELVIVVTAYLAKPINDSAGPALPTDGILPPSDTDIYLLGRLHKEYSDEGEKPFWELPLTYQGPFGYIMEGTP